MVGFFIGLAVGIAVGVGLGCVVASGGEDDR